MYSPPPPRPNVYQQEQIQLKYTITQVLGGGGGAYQCLIQEPLPPPSWPQLYRPALLQTTDWVRAIAPGWLLYPRAARRLSVSGGGGGGMFSHKFAPGGFFVYFLIKTRQHVQSFLYVRIWYTLSL